MTDFSHLSALEYRLSHERSRLATALTTREKEMRAVYVAQIEREITSERAFLGLRNAPAEEMTDDELLAALDV
jgi:hypothetical protein